MTQALFDKSLEDFSYLSYLESYLESFEKWLLREKAISEAIQISYRRFIQKCKGLLKFYASQDFSENKIITLIEKDMNIAVSAWIKEKGLEIIHLKKKS